MKKDLQKQMYIYSVDTSFFYNENEVKIHKKLNKFYMFRDKMKKRLNQRKKKPSDERIEKINKYITDSNKKIKELKGELYTEFDKNKEVRNLNADLLTERKVISVFDSTLSRTLGMKEKEVSKEIIVVQTYFFQILSDLIQNGFYWNGEKYLILTASAGQIRTKKTVFIKESTWNKYDKTLMCGLTIDSINNNGGMNINKFLAYLALSNSATIEWKNFNIDRAIVVEDLETNVHTEVDFINNETFEINRMTKEVPIAHTDGCGMILPKKSKRSFMCRLPWVKGLLVPFPFNDERFKNTEGNIIVKDIYGKEWDIEKDKIEVIFTKSQFKMWKYYSSWQDYKDKFAEHSCMAAKCNEEDKFPDAKLNYQMIQTLTDISDDELVNLCGDTITDIVNIGTDKETMMKVLGATEDNVNKHPIQEAIHMYNEILNDSYCREMIKGKKKSMVKDAKAGKINIKGKYTFICPDLYAFCEYLFLGEQNPKGLLNDQEVYCRLYKEAKELDCLRSPHLYREHAIRRNIIDKEKSKWFITDGVYTSIHDPISKLLMFDCDGDKSLVCADKLFIKIAKRNMKGIVPLYYEMAVAQKSEINSGSIYEGLIAAYKGGNIGVISNDITKVWNKTLDNGEEINLDVIKWLCMHNNFVIDYAKTLFKLTMPKEVKKEIHKYTKDKVPHFFVYAKDKELDKVSKVNKSTVNKLNKIIVNKRIDFEKVIGRFDYKKLMSVKDIDIDMEVIKKYNQLNRKKKWSINEEDSNYNKGRQYKYITIKNELLAIHNNEEDVTNMLVKHLFEGDKPYKETLWKTFGDVLVKNLKGNLDNTLQCEKCGKRVASYSNRKKYCGVCWKEKEKEDSRRYARESMRKKREMLRVLKNS